MDQPDQRHPYIAPRNRRLDDVCYETVGQPVFVTVRAYRGSQPFRDPRTADTVTTCLLDERDRYGCDVYAYSLMPEHMHIVACARKNGSNVLTFVDRFKGKSTTLWWNMGCHGKLWQPRSYDHLVRREESLLVIVKYVLDNPVRRGLAERWEDYGWCGLLDPMPLG